MDIIHEIRQRHSVQKQMISAIAREMDFVLDLQDHARLRGQVIRTGY